MELTLERIEQKVGAATHLYPLDLKLAPRAVTVLLGATQAGKTTLMRVMAGLDAPHAGRVIADGQDVTGVPVRERNVAMVYQQFINYPSMSVADNIASPLKLRGEGNIAQRVQELAAKLHIEPFLKRLPAELSGGQQQRVALARALAKKAPLMLLDEPLVNLDYKLREELREELTQLFAAGESTVVYATTEPTEALLLGGYTAVMDAGELLQYGPTAEVFRRPKSIRVARAFSDPPMNLIAADAPKPAAGSSTQAVQSLRGNVSIEATSEADTFRTEKDRPPIPRDFVQQPPLIPHSVKGYNITANFNKCMDCHSWARYSETGATKVSLTHFKTREGKELDNISPARYFCVQCHVPQTDAKPLVNNTFKRANALAK